IFSTITPFYAFYFSVANIMIYLMAERFTGILTILTVGGACFVSGMPCGVDATWLFFHTFGNRK
ncbi:MAG: hypothetical protein K2I90_10075, partial [Odoribacter sp.]|nr:hypothetical protein [Odoribacter sp.]